MQYKKNAFKKYKFEISGKDDIQTFYTLISRFQKLNTVLLNFICFRWDSRSPSPVYPYPRHSRSPPNSKYLFFFSFNFYNMLSEVIIA